ncbi:hypothetical protein [Streptomyces rubiginosohelvolus]|uniref:hypothetical protein n=1 Tax=Streptomyces rubiginosohelvolus TaxID=67362 RepID=UPI0036D2019D
MPASPTPADRPADQLRAAAEKLRNMDPLTADRLTGIASPVAWWLEWQAAVLAEGQTAALDPALAVARQLLGTTEDAGARCVCGETACESENCDCDSRTCPVDHAAEESDEEREQREDMEATARAHAAGDHEHCGPTCEAEFPTDHLRNFIIAKGYPGTAGALDELLRRAAAAPPAPADRAAVLREAAEAVLGIIDTKARLPQTIRGVHLAADRLAVLANDAAAGVQPPTTTEALADCATEYRVPVPENGGTELRLRKGHAPYASGWSVAVPGYGGGKALTELGWSDSIGALSADRLFCWPDAATAVDAARRALPAAPAAPEEPTPC